VLNQTPFWKYILVLFVVGLTTLYAAPNLYGEDHAIQISASKNAPIDEELSLRIENALLAENIEIKRIDMENDQLLVRLLDSDAQLIAQELIDRKLDDEYVVAMNLAPDTPDWLKAFNAEPIKLGLDLRGGVHFLMEVDMNSATTKAYEDVEGDFKTRLREEDIRYRSITKNTDSVDIFFRHLG
jgi:preprotein translocase subunit SecD